MRGKSLVKRCGPFCHAPVAERTIVSEDWVFDIARTSCTVCNMLFDGACGLNTLTSRNVFSWRPPQNPFTETSSLAPSDIIIGGSVSQDLIHESVSLIPPRHHGRFQWVGWQWYPRFCCGRSMESLHGGKRGRASIMAVIAVINGCDHHNGCNHRNVCNRCNV